MRQTEKALESFLVHRVQHAGGMALKWIAPGAIGVPDRIVVWKDKIDFVEMKAPHGRLSPGQVRMHRKLARLGHEVYVLWSREDIEDYVNAKLISKL